MIGRVLDKEVFWKRCVLLWASVFLFWYVAELAKWIRPGIIKWALPFFGASGPPDPFRFFILLLTFAAGVALSLAAGYWPGRLAAGFLRLGEVGLGRLIPLGWAALSMPLLGLGLVGCWYQGLFLLLLGPVAAAGAISLSTRLRHVRISPEWRHLVFVLPAGLLGWVTLLVILAPEVFQDAMRYHLFFPKRFLLEHKYVFVERYFFWSYMGLPHMLYGAALALQGELWAKAVNFVYMLLSLAALWRIAGIIGLPPWARSLLMGLSVSAPGLILITASVFVEHCSALYVLLAVEAVLLASTSLLRRRLREGLIMLGLAFMAKYTAIIGLAGIALMVASQSAGYAWEAVRRELRVKNLAWLALPSVPFGILRWIWTGDPLSPLMAKLGFQTMDASSRIALAKYYEFTTRSYEQWLAEPAVLLNFLMSFPNIFAGAHGGFWEHPGPAIPCLLLAAVVYFSRMPVNVRRLLLFCAGSAGTWFLFWGATSPHYIMGLCGLWTAAFIGTLVALPPATGLILRNLLAFLVFYQALVSLVAGTYRWGPRDVALGIISKPYYLTHLPPTGVHYPIRKELERRYPDRGTVYVYGDDTSYYLSGRVHVDYENGSDPWLWRLAAQSHDAADLRKKLRQRGWTHMLYSTRWPEILTQKDQEDLYTFRHQARTLELMQNFLRRYASVALLRKGAGTQRYMFSCVFEFVEEERAEISQPLPFLPGAEALVLTGDHAWREGDLKAAEAFYRTKLASFPNCAMLHDRLDRIAKREAPLP